MLCAVPFDSVDFRFGGSAPKYGKCVTVRKYQLVDEHAVVIKHFDTSKYLPYLADIRVRILY